MLCLLILIIKNLESTDSERFKKKLKNDLSTMHFSNGMI